MCLLFSACVDFCVSDKKVFTKHHRLSNFQHNSSRQQQIRHEINCHFKQANRSAWKLTRGGGGGGGVAAAAGVGGAS